MKLLGALIAAHLITGCSSEQHLPERADYPVNQAGDITENVNSLHDLPADVRTAYLEESKPFKHTNLKGLPPEHITRLRSHPFEIVDRDTDWNPGCGNGSRFVSAAKTKTGWWIIHESGSNCGNITTLTFVDVSASPYRVSQIMRWQPPHK